MRKPIVAIAAFALAACSGADPSSQPSASVTAVSAKPIAERLLVEGDDATRIIDLATGDVAVTLPGGVLSPTLDLIVNTTGTALQEKVTGIDLSGKVVVDVTLPGDYKLPNSYGAAPSGFSPNGKWLVLVARDTGLSHFAVIDVAHNKVANIVDLSPRFTFDAIHNDGNAMYLIEHPKPGATSYNVRFYDLAANVLRPDLIFDKASIAQYDPTVGLMDGTFHVSVTPKGGDWTYGLYMRPNGSPFVHALNVPGHYAQCIVDLAGVWTKSSRFSMTLDDSHYLYIVDAGMGTVSVIDTWAQKVERRGTFAGRAADGDASASAVISPDRRHLYATSARGIAVLSTSDLTLTGWAAPDLSVRSIALSRDGSTLYALAGASVSVIDTVTRRATELALSLPGARSLHVIAAP